MSWNEFVLDPLQLLVDRLVFFLPRFFGALLILMVGWGFALIVRQGMIHLLQMLGIDRLAEKARIGDVLERGAVRFTFVELLAYLTYWMLLVATVIVSLQFMGLVVATQWLEQFGYFIPRVLVSIGILLFGMLLASFLGAAVRAASLNAGMAQGHVIGQIVYAIVVLLTMIMALEQLQVVTRTIQVALYILLGTVGLATALAVGLGSQELVRRFMMDVVWERFKHRNGHDTPSQQLARTPSAR